MRKVTALDDFQFGETSGFLWKGHSYAFDRVKHLKLSWIKTTERVMGAKAGDYDQAYIQMMLKDGKKIRFGTTEKSSFLGLSIVGIKNDKHAEIESIKEVYIQLLQKTFSYRIEPYLKAIRSEGYFEWDKCRFHTKDRIISSGKRTFSVEDSDFFRTYGLIQVKRKKIDSRTKRSPPWDTAVFSIDTDSDVILYLLDHFFQLKWQGNA
jgi:hypothetical protein